MTYYNDAIPTTGDLILQSFNQLRTNFQIINSSFANNHIGLTEDQEFAGKHRVLVFQDVADPTTGATETALYNKLVGGTPQLFFAPSGAQTPIQLTFESIQAGLQSENPDVYFAQQYSFSAGPFVIYGGILTGVTTGQVVNLTPSTTLLHVDLITRNLPIPATVTAIAGNSFTISFQPGVGTQDIYYMAVGV